MVLRGIRFSILISILFGVSSIKAQDSEPVKQEGIGTILRLFDEKPLVAIGEIHGHQQLYTFLEELISNPEFSGKVNDIVIEAGNGLYQDILDTYIKGEAVSIRELRKVWMNTTQSPVDPWSIDVYFHFLQTIRKTNKALPSSQKIRVLAGDPPIDWQEINTLEEYNAARGSRNTFYAQVVIDEVLAKNRKALLISGGAHFGNHNPRDVLVNQRIEKQYANSVIVVQAPAGLGQANKAQEPQLADWEDGTIVRIQDTWIGALPGPGRRRLVAASTSSNTSSGTTSSSPTPTARPGGPKRPKKQDMFEWLLYFGGADKVKYGKIDPSIYQSNILWKELNRRSKIRFNHELIPETRSTGILRPVAYQ